MEGPEISKILTSWASALKEEDGKRSRLPLSDLVKKYSQEVQPGKCDISSKRSVRPWSREDFTSRLLTFQQSAAWFAKPPIVSALQCARHGWCNKGADKLYCQTCAATLEHQKVDDDGKCLRGALSTGHSSHCGWTDNFCPEEFLSFPVTSSENLVVDLLQRVRLTLLAVFEWARSICESEGGTPSSPPLKSTSSSRLKLEVGSLITASSPQLSKWLLDEVSRVDGGVLEMALSDACSSYSRAYVTAAVERIGTMLRSSNGSSGANESELGLAELLVEGIEKVGGGEDSVSPILRALLPASGDSPSLEETRARHLIRTSVLLAICGWTPVASAAPVAAAAASASSSSSDPSRAVRAALDSVRCGFCGRSFPFKYLLSSPVDPLFQHRTFCLWAHSGDDREGEMPPGWQQCATAVLSIGSSAPSPPSDRRTSSGSHGRRDSIECTGADRRECDDAEQAYKKIRMVLDQAAFPRVQTGRLSI